MYNWDNQKEHIISEGKPGLATMFDDPSVGYAFCFTTPLFIVKRYGWDALQTFLTDPSDYSVFGLADSNAFEARWSGFLDELFGLVTPAETIAQARSKGSGLATVEGTVTWQTQWDDRVYFLQDETAGISTFHTDGAIPLSEGDQIRITGQVDSFRGEIHINTITEITVLGQGAVPSATLVTGAEINAGQYQGELVEVVGTVQTIQELAYGNQRVTVRDAAGTDLPVYGDSRNGMATADWPAVGTSVRVTGVLGTDDRSDVPEGTGPRLEPRRKGDVVTVDTASLTVTTTDVGEARVGVPYNGLLEAIAGTGTGYTWSLQSGGLPSGVTLSASGTLTGTPSASGSFPFTARVDDDGGGSATAALELYSCGAVLSLGVGESLVTPFPDRCGLVLPDADAGYRVALMTRDQVYESYAVASLPGGLQMSAIAGTPGVEFLMPPQMPVMKVRSPLPEDQAFDPETLELAKATARLSWRLREEEYRSRPNAPMTVPSVLGPPLADLDVPPVELGPPPASRQFMVFDQGQGVDVTINATLRAFDDNVEYYEDAGEVGIAEDLGVVTDGTQATAQEITDLLAYYETYGKPIIDDAFGGLGPAGTTNNFKTDAGVVLTLPTDDIDQNGRLIVLQIREDRLGGAGAYVSACDRYPLLEHYNAGGNYCPRSNEAEITFFSRPDHVGFLGTLVHEAKHISSLGYAIFGGRGFNPSWIEEGTAQIARGKSSRDAAGFTDGARVGLEDMYPGGPSTAENMGMVAVNWWARSFLKASPLSGLIGDPNPNPNPNASNYYGASWLFHRFLVDAYGVGDEDSFFLSLNTGGSGVAQIEAITGQTFETLLAEFLVAIGVEGQASARAATTRRFTAYDFAGIAERWPSDGPWPYLQATAGFTTGTFSFATHYTSPSFFDYTTGGGAALRLDAFTSAASALNAGDDVVMVITRIR